ncbi:hypothetical protein [Xylophilus sp.]|uniref:hypothetical protein n=1 Tax=Xylophilus sp. TaxID=2653893 RepID=UPI0013B5EE07|nr:hypothetical protein [Xylophilus sp.]KAF1050303.1 MAG: hypothetical protein GAK38_00329 [Xylophilus sp.]
MRNQSTWRSVRLAQSRLEQILHRRHSLRLHGLVIGAVTLGGMLAASAVQRALGVETLALRWWAGRLVDDDRDDSADATDALDLLDLVPTGGSRSGEGRSAAPPIRTGGGGDFAGGGATADFGGADAAADSSIADALPGQRRLPCGRRGRSLGRAR